MTSGAVSRILLVGAGSADAEELQELIASAGWSWFSVDWVDHLTAGLGVLERGGFDLVLLRFQDDAAAGFDVLRKVRERAPHIPIVVMTDQADEELAARTMREGAQDCVAKSHVDAASLTRALRYALERKYAEQALRESEQRFRSVFEAGSLGMALVGADFELVGVNRAFCNTMGFSRDELLGRPFDSLTHPDDKEADERLAESLKIGVPSYQIEKRFLTRDGTVVWGNQTASLVRAADGTPLYGIVMVEDITERRKAEETVRRSLNLLHAVVGGTTDAVYVKDREGRYLLLNSVAAQLAGKPAAEIVGKNDSELFPPEIAQQIVESDRQIMAAGETKTFEETLGSDGASRTYLSTKGVFRDQSGDVAGLFGVARDITDRTRAEEELRRSEAKYRELVERATHGIGRMTLDGRFVSANPALAQMLGYQNEAELLAAEEGGARHWDDGERTAVIELSSRDGRIEGIEVEWRKRDGDWILVRLSGQTVHSEPDDSAALLEILVEDITERRALENELRQAQKMQAVGELTGGIAHDLNNILTVVSTNLELLGDSLPSQPEELRRDFEDTRLAVRRGTALIKKLLGFSRRSHLEMKPVDVVGVVTAMSTMVRRVVPEDIEIDLVADPKAGTVRADTGALEQILLNLVTNARDAMKEGGRMTISVRRSNLDEDYCSTHPWTTPGYYICISVSDTGIGMDQATRDRVFDPFFTTKPPELGTGLGLSMVYGLVKQQGGVVDVYSELGQGTVVNIYLPSVEDSVATVKQATPLPAVIGGSETILVVEDEEPIRRAAKRVLEKHGYKVLLAADGAEALELFPQRRDDIDLVISDMVMPRLGGAKFYEALRAGGTPPKILFTSGYADRDVSESGGIGPDLPFINKPWTVSDLLTKIREVLDK
ncbi:MAG: PAS domain S-box protein [Gemmatimonadota bacterium]|nr:MAG: PAS domain S-box protein [Gemmatimonadota bacterium]